ncbi:MAG: hypothetical protein V2I33_09450 [Kangiellaceae bacterium]|nr:hypothetical protein [Kangiellaceae bacterium]
MLFSGIGVFKHSFENPNQISKFEERVVITDANSLKEAESKVLNEFKNYAIDGITFLNEYEINEVDDSTSVIEITSTIRIFDGSIDEYLNAHWYDLQPSSCEENNWEHVWYNQGNGYSACYNCQKVVKGKLWGVT